jgi:hypothetical protein
MESDSVGVHDGGVCNTAAKSTQFMASGIHGGLIPIRHRQYRESKKC